MSRELAIGIVRGGEGATKLITITVRDARTEADAHAGGQDHRQLAAGEDRRARRRPELGTHRGRGRAARACIFDVDRATVHVGGVLLFENGLPHDDAAPQAAEHLKGTDVRIDVNLGTGGGGDATVWTCDLSAEYVRINGEYRT